jgi:hypothetical protein
MKAWKRFTAWLEQRRERRDAAYYRRMMVVLTVSPSTLEAIKQRLAEDDWAPRRIPLDKDD